VRLLLERCHVNSKTLLMVRRPVLGTGRTRGVQLCSRRADVDSKDPYYGQTPLSGQPGEATRRWSAACSEGADVTQRTLIMVGAAVLGSRGRHKTMVSLLAPLYSRLLINYPCLPLHRDGLSFYNAICLSFGFYEDIMIAMDF